LFLCFYCGNTCGSLGELEITQKHSPIIWIHSSPSQTATRVRVLLYNGMYGNTENVFYFLSWSNTSNKIAATCNKIWFQRMLSRNVDTCCLVICNAYMCEHFQLTCVEIRFCCKLQQFCCPYGRFAMVVFSDPSQLVIWIVCTHQTWSTSDLYFIDQEKWVTWLTMSSSVRLALWAMDIRAILLAEIWD
jgi:hypothetical protein